MKTLSELLTKRKKVDFRSETYNKVQDLCFALFGNKAVIPEAERDMISIIYPVSLSITFSRNECKMYFDSYFDCNGAILRSTESRPEDTDFSMCQSSFRVFSYEAAEKYLLFKKKEAELIRSLDG
jgi:hypothetical protein